MSADPQQSYVTPESTLVGERQRLMRDAVVNNLSAPVSAIVGILLVPVMLMALGQDDYGLWIVATSLSGIIAAIDFGLYWSVNRVVAADAIGNEAETADFVKSAANVYLLTGMTGCIVLGGAGLLSGDKLHLPLVQRDTATLVFWLVGATLCAERTGAFGTAVLAGLRRFDLINIIAGLTSVTWAAAVVALLINGGGVAAVAVCQLAVAVLRSIGTLWLVARLNPAFRFRPGFLRWRALRQHVSFALSSLLTEVLGSISWNSAPVLIGFISGSAAAVPFYIGQKFPLAVSAMSWRAADVLFPAASENRHDLVKSGEVLQVGSRWIVVLALPLAFLLFVAAPNLLHAWIGNPPLGSVVVLRILAVAVLADAIAVAPLHLLWGRGAIRPILIMYFAQGAGVVALSLALVYPLGVTGAAWGMLIPIGASAATLFVIASRSCAINPWKLASGVCSGLALPVLACVLGTSFILYFRNDSRLWVVAALAVGCLLYLATLFGLSGNNEEKQFARDTLSRLKHAGLPMYRRARKTAARVPFLRSAWHLAAALAEFVRDPCRNPSYFERYFATTDPWQYETGEGRKRLLLAASMLERVQQRKFQHALEIGCAEGVFTGMLAPHCESLLAVDFAPTALHRARQRLPYAHIRFEQFDLLRGPICGTFDLITAMDVLDCIFRPAVLRQVRDKLVAALEPGGYLLLVDPRQDKMFETAWWGRLLLRGGKNVRNFIGRHPCLRLVFSDITETHIFALFRKEPA